MGVGVGVSTGVGVGVGVGLGVSVGACVSECVIACVRDCFEKAWATPDIINVNENLVCTWFEHGLRTITFNQNQWQNILHFCYLASPLPHDGVASGQGLI